MPELCLAPGMVIGAMSGLTAGPTIGGVTPTTGAMTGGATSVPPTLRPTPTSAAACPTMAGTDMCQHRMGELGML